MRTAFITIFGLNTPADSDCYGLRALMQSFAGAGDGAFFFAYDDTKLLASIAAAVEGFDRIVLCGHSHGGAAVKWVLDHWAAENTLAADAAVFLDPAPEPLHFFQFFSWQAADLNVLDRWHVPLSVCRRALCIYQRNEQIIPGIIGVCGVPFVPVPVQPDEAVTVGGAASVLRGDAQVQNLNVTALGVYHCHMLGDALVQGLVTAFLQPSVPVAGMSFKRIQSRQPRWLDGRFFHIEQRIQAMGDTIDQVTQRVTDLETKAAAIDAALKDALPKIEGQITALKASGADTTALSAAVDKLSTDIDAITSDTAQATADANPAPDAPATQ